MHFVQKFTDFERPKATQRVVSLPVKTYDMIQYRPGLYLVTSAVVRHSGAPSLVRFSDACAAFKVQHDIYKV